MAKHTQTANTHFIKDVDPKTGKARHEEKDHLATIIRSNEIDLSPLMAKSRSRGEFAKAVRAEYGLPHKPAKSLAARLMPGMPA